MSATEQEVKDCIRAMLDAQAVKEKAEKEAESQKYAAERAAMKAEAEAANAVLKAEIARRKAEVKEQIARAVSEGRIPGTVKDYSVSCRIHRGGWHCDDRPGPTTVRSKLIPKYMPGADGYFDQYGKLMDNIGDQIRIGLSFDPGTCFVEESRMKPISKYRQKVLDRQPPTLLGQRLAEALKANGPSAANTRPVNCVKPDHRIYEDEQYIK